MITSTHNPLVQEIKDLLNRPKARREAQAFALEGVRLVEEAVQAGWIPRQVLYTASLSERGAALLEKMKKLGAEVFQTNESVLQAATDTQAPQGLVAVVPIRPVSLPENPDFVLVLDQLRDPGNLGTALRTAAAAGVQAVLLTPGSVDVYAPKVLRAGMGAHFRIPVKTMEWDALVVYLGSLRVYLADAAGDTIYTQANFIDPLAVVVGGEAEGAGAEVTRLNPVRIQIPMPGQTESLNAAIAAGVVLFEVVRQRTFS